MEATKKGTLVPNFKRIFSDQLTPVLAYRCLVNEGERDAPSFLFESIEQGEASSHLGRFSMLGAQPSMEIIAKENSLIVLNHETGVRDERIVEDPMSAPAEITSQWTPVKTDALPDVFYGGWVGYFSYETMRYVEKKKLPFSGAPEDDRGLPDIHLGLYNDVVVFDHVSKVFMMAFSVDNRCREIFIDPDFCVDFHSTCLRGSKASLLILETTHDTYPAISK